MPMLFSQLISPSTPKVGEYQERVIALINGRIIDGNGSPPIENGVVVIKAGKIESLGPASSITIPKDAQKIDISGGSILPGFFNAHVHEGYKKRNLKTWAFAGVTTVRELGIHYKPGLFARKERLNSDNRNARLVSAGPLLTVRRGYPKAIFDSDAAFSLKSLNHLRKKVTSLIDEGADLIKISLESGKLWRKKLPVFNDEELQEIVYLAHKRGKKVSAHLLSSQDVVRALKAGVDDLAHMVITEDLDDALIKQVIDNGVYWISTLELYTYINPRFLNQAVYNLRKFHRAGGCIALGTDFAGYLDEFQPGMPTKEMHLMRSSVHTKKGMILLMGHVERSRREIASPQAHKQYLALFQIVESDIHRRHPDLPCSFCICHG